MSMCEANSVKAIAESMNVGGRDDEDEDEDDEDTEDTDWAWGLLFIVATRVVA